jgi:SAM-dependent methyltransferase
MNNKNIMKLFLKRMYKTSVEYGFDPKKLVIMLKAKMNKTFVTDKQEFLRQKGTDNSFQWGRLYPILTCKQDEGGSMKGDYFHQDLYVAQQIFKAKPKKHLDIGSRTDGFVAHVAAFREIELIDIRPINSQVRNIIFRRADLMCMPEDMRDYCDSISSLHAIEHFGLGRYNDPIDYFGYLKGIENITQILKTGGIFYFSVPIGPQRVEFNAHRVFSLDYLIRILSPSYTIQSFSYVNDMGDLIENAELTEQSIQSNFSCWYGCGIFTLVKK